LSDTSFETLQRLTTSSKRLCWRHGNITRCPGKAVRPWLRRVLHNRRERRLPDPQAEVWIQQEGFTTNTHRLGGNQHIASSLTDNPVEIVVKLSGRSYRQGHSSIIDHARVSVPVHGSLSATLTDTAAREGQYTLVLNPQTEDSANSIVRRSPAVSGREQLIPMLHPGSYRGQIISGPSEAELGHGSQTVETAEVDILIRAYEQTRAAFEL
jgi:hypothetical protein